MLNKHEVYEFQKNANEKVKVALGEYRGMEMVDIRVHYNADEAKEEWKPSKKGITMRSDLIPELIKALEKAIDARKSLISKAI